MKRTFLVELEVGDDSDLLGLATDLKEDLEGDGYAVMSVKPWAGKTLGPVVPGSQPVIPPTLPGL